MVSPIRGLSKRLQSSVLPWIRNAAPVEPCQGLVNQAARKRSEDLDGAIEDLKLSIRDCQDEVWLREARVNLAGMYFERADLEQHDLEMASEQSRQALIASETLDEADRKALTAILARSAIEAGKKLMDEQAYEEGARHWQTYIELFGTPSFDVLFKIPKVAQGAWPLRELGDAQFQLSLTCVRGPDVSCVAETILPVVARFRGDTRPLRELTSILFERAATAAGTERQAIYLAAFDLMTAWHELDPDSFGPRRLMEETLLDRGREERLELLRLTDKCWIPMEIAEALQRDGEAFLEEAQTAAACGGTSADAQRMLAAVHLQEARDKLDRLGVTARSTQEKQALLREVERLLQEKVGDSAEADTLRSRIEAERARMRNAASQANQDRTEIYDACTQLLATIQWNMAREEIFDDEVRDFKIGCCGHLLGDTDGWAKWMRTRLADAEVENKKKLMKSYCERRN
jgi:hypothetical protein